VVPPQINKFYVFDLSQEKPGALSDGSNHMQTFVVSAQSDQGQRELGAWRPISRHSRKPSMLY